MKKLVAVCVVLAAALALWFARGRSSASTGSNEVVPASNAAAASPRMTRPAGVPAHVEKLAGSDARHRAEQQIAAARATRAQQGAQHGASPEAPHLPAAAPQGIESLPTPTLDALKEAIPYLEGCFGSDAPRNPIVLMTLEGDPDVGTLIDPGQMTDDKGAALDPALSDCLHTALTSLKLPPLAEGSSVKLQYSFRL